MRIRLYVPLAAIVLLAAACSSGSDDASDPTTTSAGDASTDTFEINAVEFGDSGFVEIKNVSGADASTQGLWVCQRPNYREVSAETVPAGETLRVDATAVGGLDAGSGEVGLYTANDFGSADAIVSYVEWGSTDHGRSSVATDAGVWTDGSFVETSESTTEISTTADSATSASEWTAG